MRMGDNPMLKVFNAQCEQCLFSKNRIVSNKRKVQIIAECIRKQQYFICHKPAVLKPSGKWSGSTDVCCNGFYEHMGHYSQLIRIAQRLNAVEMIDLPIDQEE